MLLTGRCREQHVIRATGSENDPRDSNIVNESDLSVTVFAKCGVGVLQVTRGLKVHNILDPCWQ